MTISDPRQTRAFAHRETTEAWAAREEIDFGAALSILWRGKVLVGASLFAAACLGGVYASILATPVYRATSVVILEPNQEQIVDLKSVAAGLSGDTSEINSELEVLRSRGLMGTVAATLDLANDPEFNSELKPLSAATRLRSIFTFHAPNPTNPDPQQTQDRVISALLSQVSVSNIRSSLVFRITAASTDPVKSAEIADAVAEAYIADQVAVKRDATTQATGWLATQVHDLETKLQNAESKVARYNANTELVSTEALRLLERQAKDLRERMYAAKDAKASLISDLEKDQHAQKATEGQEQKNRELARLDSQLASLRTSEQGLMRQIDLQNKDLITLQQLEREAEATRVLYEYFLTRFNETSAQDGIQQPDSRILSRAVIPVRPSEPQRFRILALASVSGLVIGVLMVLLRARLRDSFHTVDEIETATGYTVLGQIPNLQKKTRGELLPELLHNPTSAAAEAVRNLRTSLLLSQADDPPQVVLSASAMPGDGKTTNALALAQSLVGVGRRVLLLGADIRANTLAEYLPGLPRGNLELVLLSETNLQDAIYRPAPFGFDVLSGTSTHQNAADLFASKTFAALIATLRENYDYIVIDSPPLLAVPDARLLADSVDAILFSVLWGKTGKAQVREALRLLHNAGQPIAGFVFSKVSPSALRPYGYGTYQPSAAVPSTQ